ncbi:MAG TPA: S41 family peptidase [Ignavibacteria bacterium]|nr:S41 family peptidase [Bacteroidota bacterium]HRI85040.1 S41 family peptidase [Ignavibacteria bacterium]HRJ98744.1 S41 family peptidase [Ignavibacteria bacterium]
MNYLKSKLKNAYPVLITAGIALFAGFTLRGDDDIYQKINRNMELFGQVYREIALNYVDEIDADKFMTAGIEGMLSTLDPYTNYVDENSRDQIDLITTGKYGGIGITVNVRDSQVVISEVMNGYEAQKKGLRAGDIFLEIDGVKMESDKVKNMRSFVRGPVGTEVNVKIQRGDEILDFVLTRQEIILKNVSYYGYLEPESDGIAYIKLDRFTNISESEVENAIKTLKSEREMKGLVIDLRDNLGGLLDAATGILNKIVDKNSLLVITKGKRADSEKKYFSKEEPMVGSQIPVAVIINNKSASASEIVAGAVQDLDRGVIVGNKSFGKGLVQQIKDLDKKAQMKITSSRYYTPSGRWIQEKDYFKENKYGVFIDKEKYNQTEFKTLGGRIVKAFGGITPDLEITTDPESEIHFALLSKDMYFKFADAYIKNNPGVTSIFPDENLFVQFKEFLREQNFNYNSGIERKIKEIEELASEKNYGSEMKDLLDKLEFEANAGESAELEASRNAVILKITDEINKRIINEKDQMRTALTYDKMVIESKKILEDPVQYRAILGK